MSAIASGHAVVSGSAAFWASCAAAAPVIVKATNASPVVPGYRMRFPLMIFILLLVIQLHKFQPFNTEPVTKLFDPMTDLCRRFVRTRHVEGLAFAAELESCMGGIGAHVAEQLFHGGKIAMWGKADRRGPRGNVTQQLAGIAWIDRRHRHRFVNGLDHRFECFRAGGPE